MRRDPAISAANRTARRLRLCGGPERRATYAAPALGRALAAWDAAAQATGVAARDITRRLPAGRIAGRTGLARALALYLAVTAFDTPKADLARALRRPKWRVWKSCAMIEDLRDDAAVDGMVAAAERAIASRIEARAA
jgi:hypothetical protein